MIKKRDFPTFLLYSFSFLLLWEWLRPVEQLTNTGHIGIFIGFLLVSFFVTYLNVKWIWRWLVYAIFILTAINRLHYHVSFFQLSWFTSFLIDIKNNILLAFQRNWNDLSNEFRTLLFFILLLIMVYLIHYWLLRRQRIFIFFFMTLVYITVLDTFTAYSAKGAIVRTVVAGFAVMGMLTFYRIIQKERVDAENSFVRKWMVPLAGMIAISVLVGVIAPKAAPVWPDPVSFLTADGKGEGEGDNGQLGPSRIGYGTNDTQLGGPFIGDSSLVFSYEATGKTYWKVETKDMYTGKGWLPSGSTPITFRGEDIVPVYSIPDSVEKKQESARVYTYKSYQYNHLVYPLGIQKFFVLQSQPDLGHIFEIDTTKDKILLTNSNKKPEVPKIYSVLYDVPNYKASDLIQTTFADPSVMSLSYYQQYTRLPKNLPERIKQLTEKITKGKTNWFDKAKEVESYFGNSEFTYDQKDVAVPRDNQDYVDQFLFETKRGYCDNFSSTMVVMLRTIGIPARWVKGYTGGDFDKYSSTDAAKRLYKVTNNNAHSWVEVFFPNQGWVPFEPTQGFSNDVIINYVSNSTTPGTKQQPMTPPPVKKPQKDLLGENDTSTSSKKTVDNKNLWSTIKVNWKNHWLLNIFILLLVIILAYLSYRNRGKWVPYFVLLRYRFKKNDENIGQAYMVLLNQLDRYGLKRKENQTLRNYARYIDTFFSTREMTQLTKVYEQFMYHQELPEGTWNDTHKLWENLIKKTIA